MHEMKLGEKKLAIFSTLATGLVETLINAFWSFDTEPQSCGEILPAEPPDAAGFYKYVFKISGRQRFTLAYFNRLKIKRALKPSHLNSAPSGGRMRAQIALLLQFSALLAALPNHPSLSLTARYLLQQRSTTRPRYEVLGHIEALEHRRALGLVFVTDLRGAERRY